MNLSKLTSTEFDLLIIGGGITGCGIARDAALRGLKVALIEKGDFASGTSSHSSKLLHGGFRYLERGQLNLVFEALHERNLIHKQLSYLATPLPFLIPIYKTSRISLTKLILGAWLYDGLSFLRQPHMHKTLFPKRIFKEEPLLKKENLKGGVLFYDYFTNDARLTLEIAKSALQEGALLFNYVTFDSFKKENQKIVAAYAHDNFTHEKKVIKAKHFINSTGPWADITQKYANPHSSPLLRPTKGVHLIFSREKLKTKHTITMETENGRFIYLIPWGEYNILGTTDTDYQDSADDVYATRKDVESLLKTLKTYFPTCLIKDSDIISTYAGVRPLLYENSLTESETSREHRIIKDPSGLISIVGGKLTTYRKMAEELVDLLTDKPCLTHQRPFENQVITQTTLPPSYTFLVERYGPHNAHSIMKLIHKNPSLKETLYENPLILKAEMDYTIRYEMVKTLCDFLLRRTSIFLTTQDQGLKVAQKIAPYMGALLEWDEARIQKEIETLQHKISLSKRFLSGKGENQ
ncbi:MAG: glycerol-3-phosphate dehydrogenase/oxidase [Deltaproteobacteria bacterium]|nr:glycerol-3-phosphate dehydrogenase/oxidase [Deltaproteobacteria bacterium]